MHSAATEHVSGYHMAVVAGMIFFAVRAVFALLPAFSNRRPIKKCVTAVEMSRVFRILLPYCYQSPTFQGRSHRCVDGRGSVLLH